METLINPLDVNESSQRVRNIMHAGGNQHSANNGLDEERQEVISEFPNETTRTKKRDSPLPSAETYEKVDGKEKYNRQQRQQNRKSPRRKLHNTIMFMDSNR